MTAVLQSPPPQLTIKCLILSSKAKVDANTGNNNRVFHFLSSTKVSLFSKWISSFQNLRVRQILWIYTLRYDDVDDLFPHLFPFVFIKLTQEFHNWLINSMINYSNEMIHLRVACVSLSRFFFLFLFRTKPFANYFNVVCVYEVWDLFSLFSLFQLCIWLHSERHSISCSPLMSSRQTILLSALHLWLWLKWSFAINQADQIVAYLIIYQAPNGTDCGHQQFVLLSYDAEVP